MKETCPGGEELLLLLDGEIAENRAGAMRAHIARCGHCQAEWSSLEQLVADLRAEPAAAAPSGRPETADAVARLMARIDAAEAAPEPEPRPQARRALYAGFGLALAAAAWLVVPRFGTGHDDGTFSSRGAGASAGHGMRRDVGVSMYTLEPRAVPLRSGAVVAPDASFVAGYQNISSAGPVYLLVFAVDAQNAVHWLYPAYEHPGDDPSAVELAPRPSEALMPTSVILDGPSPGPMRIVAVTSAAPIRVSAVEPLGAAELATEALRARWPAADVQEWKVVVKSSTGRNP